MDRNSLFDRTLHTEESGPGVACAHVDGAVHDVLADRGFAQYAQHHTGHNIGLEGHERGFIDRGSDEVSYPRVNSWACRWTPASAVAPSLAGSAGSNEPFAESVPDFRAS